MARDKAKDDVYFNCSQEHELNYVANLYVSSNEVKQFLKRKCSDGTINYKTHYEVYTLIKNELGYAIP